MADANTTNGWGFLDKVWDTVSSTAGKLLDTVNTKNMSEAQIAQARAQSDAAAAITATTTPFNSTPLIYLGLAGAAAFFAYKLIK